MPGVGRGEEEVEREWRACERKGERAQGSDTRGRRRDGSHGVPWGVRGPTAHMAVLAVMSTVVRVTADDDHEVVDPPSGGGSARRGLEPQPGRQICPHSDHPRGIISEAVQLGTKKRRRPRSSSWLGVGAGNGAATPATTDVARQCAPAHASDHSSVSHGVGVGVHVVKVVASLSTRRMPPVPTESAECGQRAEHTGKRYLCPY